MDIVKIVNAEPTLRARIAKLEACLRDLRDECVATVTKVYEDKPSDYNKVDYNLPEVRCADALLANCSAIANSSHATTKCQT